MAYMNKALFCAGALALALTLKPQNLDTLTQAINYVHSKLGSGKKASDVTELIGDTPVVRLNYLSSITGCEIYAKLELSNPGGSAKDRIALAIVNHAESTVKLRRGYPDMVVEGTSGSTGISLALVCRAKGYEAHIVIPNDTSQDKINMLKSLGAHVHITTPAGIADPSHYVNVAKRLAETTNSEDNNRQAIFANQFETEQNWQAHYQTTGPELYKQLPSIDAFISGAGTGGTISGVAKYLKSKKNVKIVLADVQGSGLYNKIHYGVMFNTTEREGTRRRHQVDTIIEGIGLNRITLNLAAGIDEIDDAEFVSDADARYMASLLVEKEGLFIGSSSAVACVATFRQALKLGKGKTLATILCDSGVRHLSKFWANSQTSCDLETEIKNLSN